MFNRVSAEKLQPRLDADFYKKEFIANDDLLKASGAVRLSSLIDVAKSSYGVLPKSEEYVVSGVPLIRGGDLSFGKINPPEVHAPTSYAGGKGTAEEGDILILIKGACIDGPEGVARVSENEKGYIFNGSCYRLAFKNRDVDGYFFIAYSQARQFLMQKKRQVANTGISYNDEESILGYLLPNLQEITKKFIGDKVRQAERLRAWAASAQEETVREMPAYKPMISHYAESSYRVSPDILLSARLDSSFFHPDHRALDSKMKESGCQYFGKVAFAVKPGWNKKSSDSFLYYEIGGLNVSNGTIVPVETLTSEAPSRATTAVKHGDVLVSTVRPNRKNVGFVIEDAQDIPMVATSGFSVIRFESLVDAAFYHAWLRTDDATSQLMRWNSGSAYPAIDEDVPLQIFVPEFDASLRERLGQTLLDTHFALLHSAKLTNAAKLLVEDLIEGQITEAQLIAAEQALQAGNDGLDRNILGRLKTDGIDGEGAALFSDLDELYRLLALTEVE
ncbi:hypothetical protein [Aeromonas caviae]|uniref:hypothetical protein n=1 Tax=Aeromonas caviae TaxID=648 RepID=UPI00244BE570|nr:hypothetical protein [Aeromonas caviae]MDH1451020.1 hypothetical protein [Aeromonas caviae]MDH1454937.1 hypothetical protein [Aeromonas caviae]MDH1496234.1 hypothetical protein [Aeromonas caviae]